MSIINGTVIRSIDDIPPEFYEKNAIKQKGKKRALDEKKPFTFNGIPTY